MSQPSLTARTRDAKGKGATRKIRKNKQVPAVFYGPDSHAQMLTVEGSELERVLREATSENVILKLQIQTDGGVDSKHAILKELQVDPVKKSFYHADFYEISMDKEISVNVAIHLLNTPVGVTDGGMLQQVRRELAVTCLPDKIIDALELDVSGLGIGDALHVSDLSLPEGIKTVEEGSLTVAVVVAPSGAREEGEESEREGAEVSSEEG
jgi:large subunit ribosomal protein L25